MSNRPDSFSSNSDAEHPKKPVAQPPSAVNKRPEAKDLMKKLLEKNNRPVAQPPSAVQKQSSGEVPQAKISKLFYRRNLPHMQSGGRAIFITFRTTEGFILPEHVRQKVLEHCLHDNGTKMHVVCAVVMPDHVHMIFYPGYDQEKSMFSLEEILNGIKGASSHSINKMLHRKGTVWQDESFDHVLRSDESVNEKVMYVIQNPVRKGLVLKFEEYPWIWMRKREKPSQPGAAVPQATTDDRQKAESQPGAAVPQAMSQAMSQAGPQAVLQKNLEAMMREAMAVAGEAIAADEVPVGCVVYDSSGRIVGKAFDRRQHGADPLAHAEVLAIREAAAVQGDWRLDGMTLVVTLEPCPMCAGVILMARVGRVIFGATSPKWGAAGSRSDWLTAGVFPHRPDVIGGILASECGKLLSDHFRNHRKGEGE